MEVLEPGRVLNRGHVPKSKAQEQFQTGYVQTLIAAAHCDFSRADADFHGIDMTVTHETQIGGEPSVAYLDIQLKSTTVESYRKASHIAYPLEVEHYDKLRATKISNPRILVVMLLPTEADSWFTHSASHSELRQCCYWTSLYAEPAVETARRTVHVPYDNHFSVETLCALMGEIHADLAASPQNICRLALAAVKAQ